MQTLGNLINNEAVAGRSERHATVYNPATGEPRLYVSLSSADETREAIPPPRPPSTAGRRRRRWCARGSCFVSRSCSKNVVTTLPG